FPPGAEPMVHVGSRVRPEQVLATYRPPDVPFRVPIAAPLRRSAARARDAMTAVPGTTLAAADPLAAYGRREVRSPAGGILLSYDETDGSALIAPFGPPQPVVGHVRGEVTALDPGGIDISMAASVVDGVGGSGDAVHGELLVAVHEPGDELRASAIDAGATGHIVVGGSRASAETLIRARAMGVAGIVLGGMLDKELRDFEAIQHRRSEVGGLSGGLGLLLIEGFGKVGLDQQLFDWFRQQAGHMASLFGADGRLYVYAAPPPPARFPLPIPGDRVIAHRRPFAGRGGTLLRIVDGLHAAPSGVRCVVAIVRFEDGRTAAVPLANLEATRPYEA
ncbi:MAG: hypothetical protein ACRDGJ_00730, partial [Candidatus Limnocylindria bacterium]